MVNRNFSDAQILAALSGGIFVSVEKPEETLVELRTLGDRSDYFARPRIEVSGLELNALMVDLQCLIREREQRENDSRHAFEHYCNLKGIRSDGQYACEIRPAFEYGYKVGIKVIK